MTTLVTSSSSDAPVLAGPPLGLDQRPSPARGATLEPSSLESMLPVDRSQPKADHPDHAPSLPRSWAEVLLGWFTHLIAVALFAVAWWCNKPLTPGLQVALFLFVFAFPGVRRVGPAFRLVCRAVGRVIVQAAARAIVRAALPEGKPMTKGSTDS